MARDIKAKIRLEADTRNADRKLGKVEKSTRSLGRAFASLKIGLLAAAAAFTGIGIFISKSIEAFNKQEIAVNKLDQALSSLGAEGELVSKSLQQFASELQKVTTFGDEVTISALAQASAFSKDEETIKAITLAAADLSAGLSIDLSTAVLQVGRSFATQTNALTRSGIETDALAGSTERLKDITVGVANLYGGQALAASNTFAGAQARLSNALGDSTEKFAEQIIELTNAERIFRILAAAIEKANEAEEKAPGLLARLTQSMIEAFRNVVPLARETEEFAQILSRQLIPSLDEMEESLGIASDETRKLDKAVATSAKVFKNATEVIEAYNRALGIDLPDSAKDLRNELSALGAVFEQDVNKEIARNNGLLDQANFLYRDNKLSLLDLERAERAVASANEALRKSLVPVVEETKEYSLSLVDAVRNVDLLTAAELRNVDQFESAVQRRITLREQEAVSAGGFSRNLLGGLSEFAQIQGGQFSFGEGTITSPNGRITPAGASGAGLQRTV